MAVVGMVVAVSVVNVVNVVAVVVLSGCAEKVSIPKFDDGGWLAQAAPVSEDVLFGLEGIYTLPPDDANRGLLGSTVVLLVRGGGVSLFSGTNVYALLGAGCLEDGRLLLEGHWREAHSAQTGRLRLLLEAEAGGAGLCAGEALDEAGLAALQWQGWLDERSASTQIALRLGQWQALKSMQNFFVIAHRGGCRSSDYCGASENSLELLRLAPRFGVDGVELDVQSTADGVPILYHDLSFSARLVDGAYCYGPVAEFSLAHVQTLCRLEQGERIPTLSEALRTIIDETKLGGVWLDIKDTRSVQAVIDVTEEARSYARRRGRPLSLIYGLYSDELVEAYARADKPAEASCLIELGRKDALDNGCQVWAPRWTRGAMPEKVLEAQNDGLLVAFWTIDERDFIDHFLRDTRPNAILSNRPWLVFHRFQSLGESPAGPQPFPFW